MEERSQSAPTLIAVVALLVVLFLAWLYFDRSLPTDNRGPTSPASNSASNS